MRGKFAIGSVIIGLGVIFLIFTGVQQSAARHMTLDMLLEQSVTELDGRRIQLGGCTVVVGSIEWDAYRHRPEFLVTDGERNLQVRYTGNAVLPDTFQDRAQVVVEGLYVAGGGEPQFEAEIVFAKCPSKYEGQSYDDHVGALDAENSS